MKHRSASHLVAIVGGSGSGKTWLAERLQTLLGPTTARLSLDDFYRDRSHLPPEKRARLNFDNPRAIDWPCVERVLRACRTGRATRLPRYDFTTHCRRPGNAAWRPGPFVIVDGLWLLRRPPVRRQFALRIFIDCPERVRFLRRLARDVAERGRSSVSVRHQFAATVAPMHKRFVQPQACWADVVLTQPYLVHTTRQLRDLLWPLVNTSSPKPPPARARFGARLAALLKHRTLPYEQRTA
jgi:uridine kinase